MVFLSQLASFPLPNTRVHPLASFHTATASVFIKRDDEYGGLFNGTKRRKYLSLIPTLLPFEEWLLYGSLSSNHVLAMAQLAKEHHKKAWLVVQKKRPIALQGNAFLTSLFLNDEALFFEPFDSQAFIQERKALGKSMAIVPRGGDCQESFLGSLTLAYEILQQKEYHHIFIDAGTGFSAGALIAGLQTFGSKAHVHVVLMAKGEFHDKVKQMAAWLSVTVPDTTYSCYFPQMGKSFGSVNRSILSYIQRVAETEGILLDPLYNAKLFMTAQKVIQEKNLFGDVLIIHSGATASLLGFSDLF